MSSNKDTLKSTIIVALLLCIVGVYLSTGGLFGVAVMLVIIAAMQRELPRARPPRVAKKGTIEAA